jgi:hypothetical protein
VGVCVVEASIDAGAFTVAAFVVSVVLAVSTVSTVSTVGEVGNSQKIWLSYEKKMLLHDCRRSISFLVNHNGQIKVHKMIIHH